MLLARSGRVKVLSAFGHGIGNICAFYNATDQRESMMSNAQCFYPNGNPSLEDDIPCGTGSAVGCCPLNWVCEANGLCYLQNENYYGRYTCTDKSWGPGCPDICTYNNTAKGNEAVLECTAGSYCCDTNRPELSGGTDCCDASPSRFSIDGNTEVPSTSESPVQSTSSLTVSAPASSIPAQTSSTAAATATSSTCNSGLEETTCGSICCASDQYCEYAGQCATSVICESGLGETSCGSICCASDQYCAYAGQCAASDITVGSGSGTPTFESMVTAATTNPSHSVPTATGHTLMKSSLQSASLATSSVTSSSTSRNDNSTAVTTAINKSETPTTAPSRTLTHTTRFKAGVSVGGIIFLFLLLALFYCWRRRRQSKPYEPANAENPDRSNNEPSNTVYYGATEPPEPNPYTQRFPSNRPPNYEGGPADSRSRSDLSLVPDIAREYRRPQPNMQHAPALNPYHVPPPAAAVWGSQEPWRNMSPAPSYMTEDPTVRAQTPRSRQPVPRREVGIGKVPGDGRFGPDLVVDKLLKQDLLCKKPKYR